MTFLGEADIPTMLKEVGLEVLFRDSTGASFKAHATVDDSDEDLVTSEATTLAVHVKLVTFQTGTLPGAATGGTFTIDGADYRVVQVRQWGDGALTRAWCVLK